MGYREMSKAGGNLLTSAIECRHISTKLNTKRTEWIVRWHSHPSNPCELLTQWTGSLRLSGIGALQCFGDVGHSAPRAQTAYLYAPYQAWGYLHWTRKGSFSSLFICSQHRKHRFGYQEEDGCYLQILRVHPCHPTPGNTYSLSAPHKLKPSLSLEGGCKSFKKIMPVKVNCRQNKRQFKIASLSQAVFPFLLFLLFLL